MKNYEEGIYFGMPEEEYHSINLVSRSMMTDLLVDVEEAWYNSWMNKDKQEGKQTDAQKLGTAIHCAILERANFDKKYCSYPKESDFGDKEILKTNEQLSDFLVRVGEKKTGRKDELINRAMPYINPEKIVVWDNVIKEFMEKANDKIVLSDEQFKTIEECKLSLERRPLLSEFISGGYPEVTIIWIDKLSGIKCKCRLDYVGINLISELKSFSLKYKKPIRKSCCQEIQNYAYNMQFAVYSRAVSNIIKKIKEDKAKVFGEVDKEWINLFLENPVKKFGILFIRTSAPYQAEYIGMNRSEVEGGSLNSYYGSSVANIKTALEKFKYYQEKYGEERWVEERYISVLDDNEVPNIQYQF